MAQFSPFLDMYTYMFLNISFDFVNSWNTQLAELTAQSTWLDLHKLSFFSFQALERKVYGSISLSNRNCKICTRGKVYVKLKPP